MEFKEKSTFTVVDDNGKDVVCDILFTFDSDETNKSYIVYTDNSKDDNGIVQVFASIFDPNDPNTKLEEITSDKEWKIIESILSSLQEQVKEQNEQ
jgi:uncharacterized protein YrzB (UPF0473 family)